MDQPALQQLRQEFQRLLCRKPPWEKVGPTSGPMLGPHVGAACRRSRRGSRPRGPAPGTASRWNALRRSGSGTARRWRCPPGFWDCQLPAGVLLLAASGALVRAAGGALAGVVVLLILGKQGPSSASTRRSPGGARRGWAGRGPCPPPPGGGLGDVPAEADAVGHVEDHQQQDDPPQVHQQGEEHPPQDAAQGEGLFLVPHP